MKSLALDTAASCITVAAKNGENTAALVLDIGMRQSEKLLPAIDYVMAQADLRPEDLDYTVLCKGPGSFTGLRLAFAALKAIELFGGRQNAAASEDCSQDKKAANENSSQGQKAAASRVPLYGINSLDYYAHPFLDLDAIVLPVIDAHKDKFYAKAFWGGKEILACDDRAIFDLEEQLLKARGESAARNCGGLRGENNCPQNENRAAGEKAAQAQDRAADTIFVCGPDTNVFLEACGRGGFFKGIKLAAPAGRAVPVQSLFLLAEENMRKGIPPLSDCDGPDYFRASEAERNLENGGGRP